MTGQLTVIKVKKTEIILTEKEAKLKEFSTFNSKDNFLTWVLEHSKTV